MICKKCGAEIPDNTKFCTVCGAKVEETVTAEAAATETATVETPATETPATETAATETAAAEGTVPTTVDPSVAMKATGKKVADVLRKVPAKVWGIIAAAVLAIIIICNIVSCASGKSPFVTVDAKEAFAMVTSEELVTLSGKKITFDEGISGGVKYNYNDTFAAVLDGEKVLWAVNTKKATKIADDVYGYTVSFYGDTVVYTVKDGEDYAIYAYDVAKKKSKKIYDEKVKAMVMSPNGKMVALRNSDGDLLISKKGATAKKEYSDANPIAISNDGKTVYYVKNEKFYANDEKLGSGESLARVAVNLTATEVLFSANGATYYYSTKLKEAVKVKGDTFYGVVVPGNTAAYDASIGSSATIYGVKSFNGVAINIGGAIYYMSKKGESLEKICGGYSDYVMSADGKSLIYASGGNVYKVANIKKPGEPKKLADDVDARFLCASDNLKTIYYATADKELRYLKSNGKGELIADDVELVSYLGTAYGAQICFDKKLKCIVYVNEDKELYTAKTSKKSKQKLAIGDAYGITLVPAGAKVYAAVVDDDGNKILYQISSAKKVKKMATIDVENK